MKEGIAENKTMLKLSLAFNSISISIITDIKKVLVKNREKESGYMAAHFRRTKRELRGHKYHEQYKEALREMGKKEKQRENLGKLYDAKEVYCT